MFSFPPQNIQFSGEILTTFFIFTVLHLFFVFFPTYGVFVVPSIHFFWNHFSSLLQN